MAFLDLGAKVLLNVRTFAKYGMLELCGSPIAASLELKRIAAF